MLTLGISAIIMITGPFLIPRSRLHAYVQILFCIVLFRLQPGLLPKWYYFPLTVLVAALAAASARAGLFAEARQLPSKIDPALGTLKFCVRYVTNLVKTGLQGAAAVLAFCVGGIVWFLTCRLPWTAASRLIGGRWAASEVARREIGDLSAKRALDLYEICAWLWWLLQRATLAALTRVVLHMRWCFAEARFAIRNFVQTNRPRRRLINVRHEVQNALDICIAIIAWNGRRIVWLCICAVHFFSFTLGLTIAFPCLCAYGIVVSFIHLILSHGVTNLASPAVSYPGL
ncbi:hypothetical protein NLG97_g8331 [Lecanicillium saksenae]|uniref:Uncharacterized protein n=1 Tax=Lecanicillium saksenae TaxID=468837 RepID=A0ACC1QLL8_9HYPO|nr:hypothetical protein NLG97_g8331 [Lecanicillium saksenae]